MHDSKAQAVTALEALRACWTIVSAQHRDAVSDGIERMGAKS
jgi:hypothetical protein